jgi:hypothetical protein
MFGVTGKVMYPVYIYIYIYISVSERLGLNGHGPTFNTFLQLMSLFCSK